ALRTVAGRVEAEDGDFDDAGGGRVQAGRLEVEDGEGAVQGEGRRHWGGSCETNRLYRLVICSFGNDRMLEFIQDVSGNRNARKRPSLCGRRVWSFCGALLPRGFPEPLLLHRVERAPLLRHPAGEDHGWYGLRLRHFR